MWSSDVRRRDSEWAADRERVNSEVARTLEVRHGLRFSAEQIYIRKKRIRQPRE